MPNPLAGLEDLANSVDSKINAAEDWLSNALTRAKNDAAGVALVTAGGVANLFHAEQFANNAFGAASELPGWGQSLSDSQLDFSVGLADGASFEIGKLLRSLAPNEAGVDTGSDAYKAGQAVGIVTQSAGIGAVAGPALAESELLPKLAASAYLGSRVALGLAALTGATELPPVVEAIYQAGEIEGEQQMENIQQAIEAASTATEAAYKWVQTIVK